MNEELNKLFETKRGGHDAHRDINEHMDTLAHYAAQCGSIVEFGVRTGNSTCALLYGLESSLFGGTLYSYDYRQHEFECPPLEKANWVFECANTAELKEIQLCDLLFIDTLHTASQIEQELKKEAYVRRWILMHDTTRWGDIGDHNGETGITSAIYEFLIANREWRIERHWRNCNGLTLLERVKTA